MPINVCVELVRETVSNMLPTTRLYAQLAGVVRNPPSGGPKANSKDCLMLVSVGSSGLYDLNAGFAS